MRATVASFTDSTRGRSQWQLELQSKRDAHRAQTFQKLIEIQHNFTRRWSSRKKWESAQAAAALSKSKDAEAQRERVVAGAWHLSPALGERMLHARLDDHAVFLRELLPQDLKVEIESLTPVEATKVAKYLATVVGKGHAWQMDPKAREKWQKQLSQNRTKSLDAPSWLWSSVVELIVNHEGAYLEHCRKYAFSATAVS